MNLTYKQLNLLTVALTVFYDEVCKKGTTPEMKERITELCQIVLDEAMRAQDEAKRVK